MQFALQLDHLFNYFRIESFRGCFRLAGGGRRLDVVRLVRWLARPGSQNGRRRPVFILPLRFFVLFRDLFFDVKWTLIIFVKLCFPLGNGHLRMSSPAPGSWFVLFAVMLCHSENALGFGIVRSICLNVGVPTVGSLRKQNFRLRTSAFLYQFVATRLLCNRRGCSNFSFTIVLQSQKFLWRWSFFLL